MIFPPFNKKAQGISITTIIIAVLGLIVLIVLIMIFTGQLGKWGTNVEAQGKSCTDQKGKWIPKTANCGTPVFAFDQAAHPDDNCCKTVGPAIP